MQILNKLRECEQRIAVTSDGVWNLQCWNFRITTCIVLIWNVLLLSSGPRQLSRYRDWLRAGQSGDRMPVGVRFSAPVRTGPGTHPASCTMGTGSFPGGGKERPGRDADPSPPSSAVGHQRVELWLYSPYGPYGLYRASVPVQGWPLPLTYFCIVHVFAVFSAKQHKNN